MHVHWEIFAIRFYSRRRIIKNTCVVLRDSWSFFPPFIRILFTEEQTAGCRLELRIIMRGHNKGNIFHLSEQLAKNSINLKNIQ